MLLAISAVLITVISVAVVVRVRECNLSVNDFINEMNARATGTAEEVQTSVRALKVTHPSAPEPTDAHFTDSLLALGRVGLRAPDDCPAPAPAESSSLVSVPHAQSKTHDLAL